MKKSKVTIKQVAEEAGVSQSTVSRVINNNRPVDKAIRAKVEAIILKLGYKPNYFSQVLATRRSNSIGLLVRTLQGVFFSDIMVSIESTLRETGRFLIISSGEGSAEKERQALEFLISRGCDAVIVFVDHITNSELVDINNSSTPIVVLDRKINSLANQCINWDHSNGAYLATKHLIELGHKNIAYITGPQEMQDVQNRLAGYQRALQENKLFSNKDLVIHGGFSFDEARDSTISLLKKDLPFTAILYFTDRMALAGIKLLNDHGIAVPNDISVIGFDNNMLASHIIPALTTVSTPIDAIGKAAAEMAVQLADKQNELPSHHFNTELIIRDSTSTPTDKRRRQN